MLGILTALCVAVGFIFLGKIIFNALSITVADFQVAGGLILLGLAGRELLGVGAHDRRSGDEEFGVVPLGMPLIAGPALLTALLILIDTVGIVFTLVSLLLNLALVGIALCNAERFARWVGKQGLRGISKIIALLLAAIAVSLIRRGWQTPLPKMNATEWLRIGRRATSPRCNLPRLRCPPSLLWPRALRFPRRGS